MRKYSELRSSNRIDLRSEAPLASPLTLHIETTNVCNFRCVQCPTGLPDYAETAGYYQHMPLDLYEKTIDDMREFAPVKSLKMYLLGEPLLNKNLGRMIRMAKDAGVAERIEVTSNASMLTRDRAIEMIESGLEHFRASVYSVDDQRQREIIQTKTTPAEVLENVTRLRHLRDQRGSQTPFLRAETLSDTPELNQRFLDTYRDVADEAAVTFPHNWNGYQDRDLITTITTGKEITEDDCFPDKKNVCAFPFYTLAVRSNGSVVTCCVDWSGGTTVGNIREQSLLSIWRGERLLQFQRLHLEGRRNENSSCKGCTALYRSPDNLDGLSALEFQKRWDSAAVAIGAPVA
jgi:radical SAM protein with 4Fe4S-binding SPASM domain